MGGLRSKSVSTSAGLPRFEQAKVSLGYENSMFPACSAIKDHQLRPQTLEKRRARGWRRHSTNAEKTDGPRIGHGTSAGKRSGPRDSAHSLAAPG